jgi:hypothetical protein
MIKNETMGVLGMEFEKEFANSKQEIEDSIGLMKSKLE